MRRTLKRRLWRSLKLQHLIASAIAATIVVSALALAATPSTQLSGDFELGIVGGSDALTQSLQARALGAKIVRVEFSIDDSPRRMAPIIAAYAHMGIRVLPLAAFEGRLPSRSESQRLAGWAAAFGPGGSFWQKHGGNAYAIRDIEFGNETSYGYQYDGCGPGCPGYAQRARGYALAFATAQRAIVARAGNAQVGLLAQADYGGDGDEWVNGMFDAVPQLASLVAGWIVHPYGPHSWWQQSLDGLVDQTQARGAPATIPIYITELGIASDNGLCLSENYGWNRCMTYSQAARALSSTIAEIRSRYGSRIRSIFVYQLADLRSPAYSNDREGYFGVLRKNGTPKGAYTTTVRALLRANP